MNKRLFVIFSFLFFSFQITRGNIASLEHNLYNPYGGKNDTAPQKVGREMLEHFLKYIKEGNIKAIVAMLKETPTLTFYRFNLGEKIGNSLTPLAVAVIYGRINVVNFFLNIRNSGEQLVANDISEDTRGNTPLMLAVMHNTSNDMLNLLLEKGADVNTFNNTRKTPLMYAAEHGNLRIVKFLLSLPQIDVLQMDKNGKTALQLATKNNHKEIAALLTKAEGNVESLMSVLVDYITDQLND